MQRREFHSNVHNICIGPGFTAQASLPETEEMKPLIQEKYKYKGLAGSSSYVSRTIPQQHFGIGDKCESECKSCNQCIEKHGYLYCSMHDLCWGCFICRSHQA